jgi:hypothetical protein
MLIRIDSSDQALSMGKGLPLKKLYLDTSTQDRFSREVDHSNMKLKGIL